MPRYVTEEPHDPRSRFGLYRLCQCTACGGTGKDFSDFPPDAYEQFRTGKNARPKCRDCRGEGRIRQEVASCESPEAVGVALVTLAREGEWSECPFGLLDRYPECEECEGSGRTDVRPGSLYEACRQCKGSGVKPTGTWLILPWLPSPRNVSDAGKLLRSRRSS